MKNFLNQNKIFVAIIIATAIYFNSQNPQTKLANSVPVGRQAYEHADAGTKINAVKKDTINVAPDVIKTDCNFTGEVLVTKVIDGDTIVVEGGLHVRLLEIDADEKGYPCYDSARIELENLILNKKIILEKDKSTVDQYGRCLDYVFLENSTTLSSSKQNINIEMVKRGLAVARFYAPDLKYKSQIKQTETNAIADKVGCKWNNLK